MGRIIGAVMQILGLGWAALGTFAFVPAIAQGGPSSDLDLVASLLFFGGLFLFPGLILAGLGYLVFRR